MKSLHILVLEDNKEEANSLINFLITNYTVSYANTVVKAKSILKLQNIDLALLDISLKHKTEGIDFAKYLIDNAYNFPFIFLTSMLSKNVFDQAKLTKPYTYFIKPFNEIELQYTIELALEKYYNQQDTLRLNADEAVLNTHFLFVKKNNKIFKLDVENIDYIHVEKNYSTLYINTTKYVIKLSLAKLKDVLQTKTFEQVHRSYLVNLKKIKEIDLNENTIYLQSKLMLSISDRYKKQFIQAHHILK